MGTKIITFAFLTLVSLASFAGEMNHQTLSPDYNLESFALSICLSKGFADGDIHKEANAAVGAYVEKGTWPAEAYEEAESLARQFLQKNYLSKSGTAKLTVMKCIDLSQSDELKAIKDKYAP